MPYDPKREAATTAARGDSAGKQAGHAAYDDKPDFYGATQDAPAGPSFDVSRLRAPSGPAAKALIGVAALLALFGLSYAGARQLHASPAVPAAAAPVSEPPKVADASPDAETEAAWVQYLREIEESIHPGEGARAANPLGDPVVAPASLAPDQRAPASLVGAPAPAKAPVPEKLKRLVEAIPVPVKAHLAAIPSAERAKVISGVRRLRMIRNLSPGLPGDRTAYEVNGASVGILDESRVDAPLPYVFQPEENTRIRGTILASGAGGGPRLHGLMGPDGRSFTGPREVGNFVEWSGVIHASQALIVIPND